MTLCHVTCLSDYNLFSQVDTQHNTTERTLHLDYTSIWGGHILITRATIQKHGGFLVYNFKHLRITILVETCSDV
jgi:hypothetical protein